MKLNWKAVSPLIGREIPAPYYASAGAAAMDLHACLTEEVVLPAGGRVMIPTGIAIALPSSGYVALIFARSGLGTKFGVSLANGVGVIDSDYRGEIKVGLLNNGSEDFIVRPGDRVAQMGIFPVFQVEMVRCEELDETQRGTGGFGSTGRN
ncbi:MAG: dUTP diphosphatase [Oscillospiraceae bacterium]|nr:dUTP diphosphatase [Oscillospiraceae bacterium]